MGAGEEQQDSDDEEYDEYDDEESDDESTATAATMDAEGVQIEVQVETLDEPLVASPMATPSARTKRTSVIPKKPNTVCK